MKTLNKSDKKLARMLIDKGLEQEYENSLKKQQYVLEAWKNGQLNNREAYLKIYDVTRKNDKHISKRYDNLTGTWYLPTVINLFSEGILNTADIKGFHPEIEAYILQTTSLLKNS